jgi:hypothetical protein
MPWNVTHIDKGRGDTSGRPPDDLKVQKLVAFAREGNSRENVCRLAHVDQSTLSKWLSRAKAGDPAYIEFYRRFREAEGLAERDAVLAIREGAKGWQGQAWWLERRKRWTWRRPTQYVEPDVGADIAAMSDEEIAAELAEAQKALATAAESR